MIDYFNLNHLNKIQLNQVISFFKKNFPGNKKKLQKHFSIDLKNNKKHKWTLAYFRNNLCGAYLIKSNVMNYQGIKLKILGTSYIAVDKKFQKFGIAEYFKNKLFKLSNKHDFILGFARKKMDGYWVPYNFVGITDFGVLNIDPLKIKIYNPIKKVKIINFKKKYLTKINKIYKINDQFITGNLVRTISDFKKYFKINPLKKVKVFTLNNMFIGYMILQNNIIIEIRINPKYYKESSYSIKEYFLNRSIENVEFKTNLNDPFLIYLSQFSHQISTRYFYEGGHVIRIVNIRKLLDKLSPVLKKKLTGHGINSLSVSYEGIFIVFRNKKIKFKFLKEINVDLITKLIFGIIPIRNSKLEVLFGNTKIQFPQLDHF